MGIKMAEPERDVICFTVVVTDNGGFGCINRLQIGTGGAGFNNLLDHAVHAQPSAIDFAADAAAMGASSVKVSSVAELEKALSRRREVTGPYVIVIDTDPYLEGRLADDEGAEILLKSARETAQVGKRLGVDRLNLLGTGLGDGGIPIWQHEVVTGRMWLKARDTLNRICDLAEEEGVVFTLQNLYLLDRPGCPFGSTEDVLALVSSVDRPGLRINLDLYHSQIGEGDLLRWCEKCLPWIGEVQVSSHPMAQ